MREEEVVGTRGRRREGGGRGDRCARWLDGVEGEGMTPNLWRQRAGEAANSTEAQEGGGVTTMGEEKAVISGEIGHPVNLGRRHVSR